MPKFWMIYVEEGGKPSQIYASEESAALRCEKLARITRKPVYMLEAMRVFTPVLPEPESTTVNVEVL